ncbi:ABC transporter ATP-binding protein [Billgrantia endophytica]|uniref:Nitrate/sulfonate/bicarbonate ABC transporter ATP-binding protein n=1 Tax=Billgrantia endophytica TaxID=2033802 RepID=A0A2N7U6P1_9GAMM|nr:ABC transporter ATP-binding protein [Halomonas endophytica]PMR76104.1 nitrate/sulfonate/bicarbonate ABC transporter ATP-binding protein [Halomonas endophytica]
MTTEEKTKTKTLGKAAISLNGVGKKFSNTQVLEGISLDVSEGEIVALLGRSGCGKSTLLNIISGLLPFDQGTVSIEGVISKNYTDWHSIAYMFQEDRLLPWRSIIENVCLSLETGSSSFNERRQRAMKVLKIVGLEQVAHAWPYQLSGGMRSRAALARSLVINPSILLMDEPFSKLDPLTRSLMHTEVLRLQRERKVSVLLVTHDVEEAVVLADRIVVLAPSPGRVATIEPNQLSHPRVPTDPLVAEKIRQLRLKV